MRTDWGIRKRRWIYPALLALGACASNPRADQQSAFELYWNCAFAAARPHIDNRRLSPHDAAMRAQAECYDDYVAYQAASGRYVRSEVTPDGYQMATNLAHRTALQKKRYVTRRLTEWVAQARR